MINFTGKLIVDDSLYKKLRYSSADEIINTIKPFVEAKNFIINEDIFIKATPYAKGDSVIIKYGSNIESEVACSSGKIESKDVLFELLRIACYKNNIRLKNATPKAVINGIKNHYKPH